MHPREEIARKEIESLTERVRASIDELKLDRADVVGPNPCALPRLRARYRYDILIRTASASDLRRLTQRLTATNALRTKAQSTVIDVDPVSMT
jgi:primosomal protein N'